MKKERSRTVLLVIGFMAAIAAVGTITFNNYEDKTKEEFQKAKNELDKTVEESKTTNTEQIQAKIEEQETPIVPEPIVEQSKTLSFTEQDVLTWPVEGNVLLNYSMDHTIYFPTLDQYKYSSAIVISGEVGNEVRSAEDGKVIDITTDAQTGKTVKIDIGDGFTAVYGQLGELNVNKGDYVEEGNIIGYLGEPTKYYTVEGPNLYFQLLKNGKPVNPLEYLDV